MRGKRLRSLLLTLFYATGLGACLPNSAATAAEIAGAAGKGINFKIDQARDGKRMPFKNLKINNVYVNDPTPGYQDGEIVIITVSTTKSLSGSTDDKGMILHEYFYHNTKTGDPNFYQQVDRFGHDGDKIKYRKNDGTDLSLHKDMAALEKWKDYLSSGKGSLVMLPDCFDVRHAFKTKDGRYVILAQKAFNSHGGKEDNKLIVISADGQIQEYDTKEYFLFRDGGTINLKAQDKGGTPVHLYIPKPQSSEPAKLDDKFLIKAETLKEGEIPLRSLTKLPGFGSVRKKTPD